MTNLNPCPVFAIFWPLAKNGGPEICFPGRILGNSFTPFFFALERKAQPNATEELKGRGISDIEGVARDWVGLYPAWVQRRTLPVLHGGKGK